jgi:hypothetical protein
MCDLGAGSTARATMVLLGDSHAAHWFRAFGAIGAQQHVRVRLWAATGCCPFMETHREQTTCVFYRNWVMRRLTSLRPAYIVLAFKFKDFNGPVFDETFAVFVRWLQSLRARVLVLLDRYAVHDQLHGSANNRPLVMKHTHEQKRV